MCVQNCRTFLWGGTGNPVEHSSPELICSCTCDSDDWADHNILGKSSCVPSKVHAVFGWVGLTLAILGLFHAVYQLQRQLKFHQLQIGASITPAERCRKHMHITAIINAILCLLYFSMILLLDDDRLHLSTVVLLVLQITVMVCGFLTVRMWIYTNDRRLMQGNGKIIRISTFLESTRGQRKCYVALAAGPFIGTAFALAGRVETAVKIVGVTFMMLIVFADFTFWIFGRSLLRAIDASLANSQRCSIDATSWATSVKASVRALTGPDSDSVRTGGMPDAVSAFTGVSRGSHVERGRKGPLAGAEKDAAATGRRNLNAAKRKVKWAMMICAQFSLQGYALLVCSVFTRYGTAAPSVIFGIQMAILPLIWHVVNTQLHAGRSRLGGGVRRLTGRRTTGHGDRALLPGRTLKMLRSTYSAMGFGGQSHSVAPIEGDREIAALAVVAEAGTDRGVVKTAKSPS